MNLVYFLGRFHVLVLHLPIGIILLTLVLEWLARKPRYQALGAAAGYLWIAAAASAIVTVVLGYLHFAEGSFSGSSANAHRLYGTSVAVVTTLILLLRAAAPAAYRRMQIGTGLVLLVLLVLTGHYGGNLTHGSDFLVQYAPGPLRSLAAERGGAPAAAPGLGAAAARAQPAALQPAADPQLVETLYQAGFLVRQVALTEPLLTVSVYTPGKSLDADQLAVLAPAAAQVTELDLHGSGLDDRDLEVLRGFSALTRLRVDNNEITDAGVQVLASLPRLASLNLYGNAAVGDASVAALAAMANLERVYLWQTGVSAAGAERLRQQRPGLSVELATTERFVTDGQAAAERVGKD